MNHKSIHTHTSYARSRLGSRRAWFDFQFQFTYVVILHFGRRCIDTCIASINAMWYIFVLYIDWKQKPNHKTRGSQNPIDKRRELKKSWCQFKNWVPLESFISKTPCIVLVWSVNSQQFSVFLCSFVFKNWQFWIDRHTFSSRSSKSQAKGWQKEIRSLYIGFIFVEISAQQYQIDDSYVHKWKKYLLPLLSFRTYEHMMCIFKSTDGMVLCSRHTSKLNKASHPMWSENVVNSPPNMHSAHIVNLSTLFTYMFSFFRLRRVSSGVNKSYKGWREGIFHVVSYRHVMIVDIVE